MGNICCRGFTKILGDDPERLDPKMIENLSDVVERIFSKMST